MAAKELINTTLFSDPVYWYMRFEDDWNDSSTDVYHLTAANTPTFVTGKFGKAANFVAGSSQYAYRALASMGGVADVTTNQTWMFWIKIPSFTDSNYFMGNSNGSEWFMYGDNVGGIKWTNGLSVTHSVTLPDTTNFHHVCFTYDSTNHTISSWLNGVIVQSAVSVTGTFTKTGTTNFAIGRAGDYAGYGTVILDDMAMFPRAFTQTDVNKIFPSASSGFFNFF